jgi:hypothetical protein
MLLGAHLMAGAVAGEYVDNPYLAFVAGVILHFILDAIPHFDTTDDNKLTFRQLSLITIEGVVGVTILYFCYQDFSIHKLSFLAGALGGIFPDLLDNVPFWEKRFQKNVFGRNFHFLHKSVQSIKLTPIPGLAIQYIIIAVAVLILIKLK